MGSRTGPPRRRGIALLSALLVFACTAACTTLEHGYATSDIASQTLATGTAAGAERMRVEAEYDSAVQGALTRHGSPEFLHVVDRNTLYLYYVEADRVVIVRRQMLPPGELQVIERIPGHMMRLLPAEERERMVARRKATRRTRSQAPVPAKRAPTQPANPKPKPRAAIEPEEGMSFRNFDPRKVVARLRTPMSAADPGVSDWRRGLSTDGSATHVANLGSTRYQVRPEQLTVSAPIAPRVRSTPERALHALFRVNQAVFGGQAAAISRRLEPLVSRVAADTSGRTRVVRRIAGRTVSIARDPKQGVLVYSVHAR